MIRTALIQMRSGRDMARNLADAAGMIREAAAQGAAWCRRRKTNILEPDRPRLFALAKPEAEDESVRGFQALAGKLGVALTSERWR